MTIEYNGAGNKPGFREILKSPESAIHKRCTRLSEWNTDDADIADGCGFEMMIRLTDSSICDGPIDRFGYILMDRPIIIPLNKHSQEIAMLCRFLVYKPVPLGSMNFQGCADICRINTLLTLTV